MVTGGMAGPSLFLHRPLLPLCAMGVIVTPCLSFKDERNRQGKRSGLCFCQASVEAESAGPGDEGGRVANVVIMTEEEENVLSEVW